MSESVILRDNKRTLESKLAAIDRGSDAQASSPALTLDHDGNDDRYGCGARCSDAAVRSVLLYDIKAGRVARRMAIIVGLHDKGVRTDTASSALECSRFHKARK